MKRRAPCVVAGFALVLLAVSLVSPAAAIEEADRLWLVGERAFADGLYPAARRVSSPASRSCCSPCPSCLPPLPSRRRIACGSSASARSRTACIPPRAVCRRRLRARAARRVPRVSRRCHRGGGSLVARRRARVRGRPVSRGAPCVVAGFALVLLAVSLVSPAAAIEEADRLWLVGERAFADGLYPAARR